jgi:hypothetical protein
VPPEAILQTLADAGFTEVRYEVVMPGVFCQYTAKRPLDSGRS